MVAHETVDFQGTRVLVVDDDADTREMLAAAEALVAFERERPHVVISDIGLPDEDGFALLRKLRDPLRTRGSRVPVIALTGYSSRENQTQMDREGFQAHLTKPVELTVMLATVARVLQSPRDP
jgi:CheY-like chemotaxis protein